MSYTRSYTFREKVSGTVSVRDGNGNVHNVPYTDYADVTVNITVDTEPFDYSIARTCEKANNLTGAVIGMQAAQVKEIQDSAGKVSNSMTRGFFNLISKDVTEQRAEQLNILNSRCALLATISKDLGSKMDRMEEDIERLKRHYYEVFSSIDADMEKRILELDRNVFNLSGSTREDVILKPFRTGGSFGIDQQSMDARMNNTLTTARIRKKVSDVLDGISDYTTRCVAYKAGVSSMLDKSGVGTSTREYVPAIICQQQKIYENGSREFRYLVPEMVGKDRMMEGVDQYACHISDGEWKKMSPAEVNQIEMAYYQYVSEASGADNLNDPVRNRVYEKMMELWKNNRDQVRSL